jgi:hypothetical protein
MLFRIMLQKIPIRPDRDLPGLPASILSDLLMQYPTLRRFLQRNRSAVFPS